MNAEEIALDSDDDDAVVAPSVAPREGEGEGEGPAAAVPARRAPKESAQQRRLRELRERLDKGRRSNRKHVVEEARRLNREERDLAPMPHGEDAEQERREESRRDKMAGDLSKEEFAALQQTQRRGGGGEDDEPRKRKAPVDVLDPIYAGVRKRQDKFGISKEEYDRLKAQQGDNPAFYGDLSAAPAEVAGRDNVRRMVKDSREFHDKIVKESEKRQARLLAEGTTVIHINKANKVFNKRVDRFYDKYTKEMRDNFERGTAL